MEVLPGIHLIKGTIANSYIVVGEGELGLIDTGMPSHVKKIRVYLAEVLHRSITDVKWIALTHCDVDHAGCAATLRQLTGATIIAHPADAEILAGRRIRPQQPATRGAKMLAAMSNTFIKLFGRMPTFEVDQQVNEADHVGSYVVYHTPGHTPGSIALLDSARRVLFTGDTLMYERGKLVPSPPAFTADPVQTRGSLQKIASLEFDTLLGGHGDPLVGGANSMVREWLGDMTQNFHDSVS